MYEQNDQKFGLKQTGIFSHPPPSLVERFAWPGTEKKQKDRLQQEQFLLSTNINTIGTIEKKTFEIETYRITDVPGTEMFIL